MNDQTLYEVLQRAARDLTCPACKRHFDVEELKVRGAMDRQYLVQASCHRGHLPALVLYVLPSKQVVASGEKVTVDDVLDLHSQLKTFNGDFRSVFKSTGDQKAS